MDKKTEELRNIFMEVAGEETVTERQEESPGTLTGEQAVDDRLDALIARMTDRYTFTTDLDTDALRSVARGFYADRSDQDLAGTLDIEADAIFRARLDLHLVRESDRDFDFDLEVVRKLPNGLDDPAELADRFDADIPDIDRARLVVATEREMRRANYRFRDELDELLGDGDVVEHITDELTDDGLKDATEGVEVNTSF